MTVRAFDITFKDEAVQTVNLKAGTWTFHALVNALTYSIGLKDSTGVWHNYDLSDQTGAGWYDVQETITTDFDAVEISLLNNVGTAQVLFPMFEKGSRKSVKRPHEKDIEEAAIIKSASWEIHTSSPVIYKDAPDLTADGAHTPVTVTGRHWVGSTMTEEGFITVTANDETEAANASPSPVTIAPLNNADKHTYTIRLYVDANKTELLDYETIPVVFKGAKGINAIRLHINNPVDVLPADSDGNVLSFTGTGTSIHVFEGAVELDYDGIGAANGKFKVTAVPTSITMGAITDGGNICVVADATAMTAEKASIVYTVTGKTLDGFDFTVSGEQNFTKTKMGQDGDGILSVIDYYGLSTSASVLPSTWQTTVPAKGANEYLWNYEKILYTDGTFTDTEKRVIQGKDGRGITSIVNAYGYSTDYITPPHIWYYLAQLPAKQPGQVLWVREDITYTDGSSDATIGYPVRDGEPGDPGETGEPGTGVDRLRTEYYLSTSSTAQTGGTWQTTVPVWVSGTYIWERIVTVMSDLTEVIGTPYLSRTWETINQLHADIVEEQAKTQFQTTIDGGLIYTALMKLFNPSSGSETAGISGNNETATNPAFYAGGTYAEALSGTAKAIIRHDGTVKFTSAEITGTVNAISGTFNNVIFHSGYIGGFRVSGTGLTNGPDFNNDAYIIFRNDENKTFAGIGGNVLPSSSGLIAVARFENGATNNFYGATNYGVIIEASGASRNIGISLVGDIVMKGALVSIEPTFQSMGYTDSIILNISKYRRFLFTPGTSQYLSVDLPSSSQIVNAFGSYKLPSYWNIEIEIEVAWNASGSIALRGSSGGIFVNNNGDVVNHEDTYTYGIIKMKKGDVVTVRYNSYHGRWQLINHSY